MPVKNVFVITNEAQLPEVRKQLPKIPASNLIAEPVGRDTCAAVTLGAALVGARSTTGVMAVLPADHVMPDAKKFQQILNDAFDLASRGQAIVTIGIKPAEPQPDTDISAWEMNYPRRMVLKNTKPHFSKRSNLWKNRILKGPLNTLTAANIAGTQECSSGVL